VKRADVVDFLASLYLRKLDARSVARHLVSLTAVLPLLLSEELIPEDPVVTVESPKFRQSLPQFLSVEEWTGSSRSRTCPPLSGCATKR